MDLFLIIILGSAIIALASLIDWHTFWIRRRDTLAWNDGICTECTGSPMVWFSSCRHRGRGYRCDECQRRIWISYGVDK